MNQAKDENNALPQVRIGVDMVDVKRMRAIIERNPHFVERVFTPQERTYCEYCTYPAQHYAARFAAREAALKALGSGWRGMKFCDISVELEDSGMPKLRLEGQAQRLFDALGAADLALSLSHTHEIAVANVVLVPRQPSHLSKQQLLEQELTSSFKQAKQIIYDLEQSQQELLDGMNYQQRIDSF